MHTAALTLLHIRLSFPNIIQLDSIRLAVVWRTRTSFLDSPRRLLHYSCVRLLLCSRSRHRFVSLRFEQRHSVNLGSEVRGT
jgi:hypothetical protein